MKSPKDWLKGYVPRDDLSVLAWIEEIQQDAAASAAKDVAGYRNAYGSAAEMCRVLKARIEALTAEVNRLKEFEVTQATADQEVAETKELLDRLERMTAVKDKALVMLKRFEWYARGHEDSCPECHNLKRFGHADDCALGRLIKELEELK